MQTLRKLPTARPRMANMIIKNISTGAYCGRITMLKSIPAGHYCHAQHILGSEWDG